MTPDNPFSTPYASLIAYDDAPSSSTLQPYTFIAAQIFVTLSIFGTYLIYARLSRSNPFLHQIESLPALLADILGCLIIYSASVLLLVHAQRERYSILRFRFLGRLLVGYAVLSFLFNIALNAGLTTLSSGFFKWVLAENYSGDWAFLFEQSSGPLNLLFVCLLPLWMVLRFARSRSERSVTGLGMPISGWQLALGIALCFSAVIYKVAALLIGPMMFGSSYPLALLICCALPFIIVLLAARRRLPAQVQRFAPGRVLVVTLVLLLMWGACLLAISVPTVLLVRSFSSLASQNIFAYAPTVIGLALLWPLARWCAGRFFAEQLAQSSPR